MRLIDADALFGLLKIAEQEFRDEGKSDNDFEIRELKTIRGIIDRNCPTVNPKPTKPDKHGEWIEDCCTIQCSECGAEYSDEIIFMGRRYECEKMNYCPNCGAKMDEPSP